MRILFLTILFFALSVNAGIAQYQVLQRPNDERFFNERYQDYNYFDRTNIAIECAKELKRGTLVVRLTTYQSKIDKLMEMGKEKVAEDLRLDMLAQNKDLVRIFKEYYNFSDYVFIYGHMLPDHLEGKQEHIFLDENLEIDESIQIKDGPIFYFGGQATSLFYLMNHEFTVVERPAPYAVQTMVGSDTDYLNTGIGRGQGLWINRYKVTRGVTYLNKKLHKLSQRSRYQ